MKTIEELAREAGFELVSGEVYEPIDLATGRGGCSRNLSRFAAAVRREALEAFVAELMDMHSKCSSHNYYHCAANDLRAKFLQSPPSP